MKSAIILVLTLLLSFCETDSHKSIKNLTGLKLDRESRILHHEETHGGFLGDGHTYIQVSLTEEQMEAVKVQLSLLDEWLPLPYPETYRNLDFLLPHDFPLQARSGYVYLQDYQLNGDYPEADTVPLWDRASFNFTMAILDFSTGILWVYNLDT